MTASKSFPAAPVQHTHNAGLLAERTAMSAANGRTPYVHSDDVGALTAITAECVPDVFGTYGVALEVRGSADEALGCVSPFVSFIGFGGDTLRGTLIIVAPLAVLRASYTLPLEDTVEAAPQIFDWAGELANQILGRLKNRLTPRGVNLIVSMPKVMLAQHFQFAPSSQNIECKLGFRAGEHPVGVWLEAIAANAKVPVIGPHSPPSPAEGDILLF